MNILALKFVHCQLLFFCGSLVHSLIDNMRRIIERQKNFMNTTITLKVVQTSESTVKINEAIEEAYAEFDRIVKQYTRFNEDSELSNLNRQNGEWVKVTDEFF